MQFRLATVLVFLLGATVGLLTAGEAGATFDLGADAACLNIGNPGDTGGGDCLPIRDPFGDGYAYVSGQTGTDLWFSIDTGLSSIVLSFTEDAAGQFDVPGENILLLGGIDTIPDALVQLDSVDYSLGFGSAPLADPIVINTGLPNNVATIIWSLVGLDPSPDATATLNFSFGAVPEPGTALLLASGLIGLGFMGRRRLH